MSRRGAYAFVFGTGMTVTAVEITASRALAPFFGTSLFVWANVIGITLLALAFGYAVGGKLVDRRPSQQLLMIIVLVAAVYCTLIPLLVRFITLGLLGAVTVVTVNIGVILVSFFASVILFFPPVFCLAMVTPFLIRLQAAQPNESGEVAGGLFAASTVGSILGVFIPAFVLIPFVGVRETFFLGSAVLIVVVAIAKLRTWPWVWALLLLPLAVFWFTHTSPVRASDNLLEERDSAYQYLRILQEEDNDIVLRINDGLGYQSVYNPNKRLFDAYFDYYSLLPYFFDRPHLDVLLIGLAGGTISRQYDLIAGQQYDIAIDGVEIDPDVVQLARQYFDLDRPILTVHVADGRRFLETTNKEYDIIIVDAYSQQVYIPPHVATLEFFQAARDHLRDDGVFAINVNTFQKDSQLMQHIALTLNAAFPYVTLDYLPEGANVLTLASPQPLDVTQLLTTVPQELMPLALTVQDAAPPAFTYSERKILTDNRSPVELLTESMFFDLLVRYNNE